MHSPLAQPRIPGNQFAMDRSAMDLDQMGHVTSSGSLNVTFFYLRVKTEDPLNPDAHGKYVTQLCVSKQPRGDQLTVATRFISERQAQQLFPREYAYFKQSQDVPTDGTPLHELPQITQSQIAILVIHGIRCIEDLVGLSRDQVGQIGMDAVSAYAVAKKWVDARNENYTMVRDALAEEATAIEIARLRKAEEAHKAQIMQMQAKLDLLTQIGVTGQGGIRAGDPAAEPIMIDTDDGPDAPAPDALFSGASLVTDVNDLDDDTPEPAPKRTRDDPLGIKSKR